MTTTTVSGQSFVRTLRHYLDANESKLLTASNKSDGKTRHNNLQKRNPPALPAALSSNNHIRSSVGFPYMSLLAVTSSSSTQPSLDKTLYMPTSSCFSLDIHYLYFLYAQFENLGLDIDASLLGDVPPEGIVTDHVDDDTGKAPSILSIGSVASNMSTLSLGAGWQFWKKRQDTQAQTNNNRHSRTIQDDIIHIHHCLSRITALKLHMHVLIHPETGVARSGQRAILGYEAPLTQQGNNVMLSLSPFHQLSFLELDHIHPRMVGGWTSFAPRLMSLVIKRAGIEDAEEIVQTLHQQQQHDEDHQDEQANSTNNKCGFHQLQMLSLQDNNLTTLELAPLQQMQSLTHLNVSSNLLIDVPHSLSILYNLHSLNLSHNMISFTTGINTILGNIQELNLRGNRLTNIVGLDRLWALERLDLRDNRIEDMTEMTRLTNLPNLDDVWVAGNPFTSTNTSYRVDLFNEFHQHNPSFKLDGTGPSFAEKLRLQTNQQHQHDSTPAATTSASPSPVTPKISASVKTNKDSIQNGNDATTTATGANHNDTSVPDIPTEEGKPMKIARAKTKKTKRVIRLRQDMVEPSMETTDAMDDSSSNKHVLRYAELQQAVQPTLTRRRSNASKRSTKSSKSASAATSSSGHGHHHYRKSSTSTYRRSQSPPPPTPPSSSSFTAEPDTTDDLSFPDNQRQQRLSAEEAFRRKIEMMRQEAGTGWLRVLQEMETNKEKLKDGSMAE
ncbi:hypothetical protein BCR42DRAFT_421752 [Absidia repens]|uniref:L domain-like protein n=1 Tax=Absidia repens TaxID=90262 RepID=A0A1X2I7Y3_9FUNG|nr:hypothetical protein BCR42DRAFT_421752 [Absidia repens]